MSFDKQIQDKFSGFEPEVPDEHIDAGWEKIKYFLPQEERKKRAFFFYRRTKGTGIAVLAMLVTGLFLWWMSEQGKMSTAPALQRTTSASRSAGVKGIDPPHTALTQHPEKNPEPEASHVAASAFAVREIHKAPAIHQEAEHSSIDQLSDNHSAVAKPSAHTGHLNGANPGTGNSPENTALAPFSYTRAATDPEWMLLLKKTTLDQERPLSPEPELALLSPGQDIPARQNTRTAAIEVFSGLTNRSLMLQTEQGKNTIQAYGFSAGMAGIFLVKPKLYLSGQFMFSYNPVKYHEETQASEIIKKEVVTPISSSLTNYKDTVIYYVPYQSTVELESSSAYHLSGGVGYQLLTRGRLGLDGSVFLDFRWMRFNYRTVRVNSDTGVFVNTVLTSNAASFYESVEKSPAPESPSGKKPVMSLGVSPCLSLAYQLNRNTALFFRPTYRLQLSPNTLQVGTKSYQLKENNWFISLGLRQKF